MHIDEDDNRTEHFEYWFKDYIWFNLNDKVDEVTSVNINNNSALTTKKISNHTYYMSTDIYYGFESANHYYMLKYSICDDTYGDSEESMNSECYSSLDKILSTIEIYKGK